MYTILLANFETKQLQLRVSHYVHIKLHFEFTILHTAMSILCKTYIILFYVHLWKIT